MAKRLHQPLNTKTILASDSPSETRFNPVFKKNLLFLIPVFLLWIMNADAQQYNYGTGALGAVTISTSGTMAGGTYNYTNFTINTGVVVTVTGSSPLIIRCTGTFTNNGEIVASGGAGVAGVSSGSKIVTGTAGGTGVAGGAGGGAGANAPSGSSPAAGTAGTNFGTTGGGGGGKAYDPSAGGQGPGGGGAGYGTAGTAGSSSGGSAGATYNTPTLSTNVTNSFASVPNSGPATTIYLCGGSGGGGGSGSNASALSNTYSCAGAGGGAGGGVVQITANTITIGSQNPAITVAGGAGGKGNDYTAGAYGGGGGGGSGGTINLQYFTYTNSLGTNANLVISGGTGGAGGSSASGNGGAGGSGILYTQVDEILCTQPTVQASAISATVASSTSLLVTVTRGNGTGGLLVIARTTATGAVAPTYNTGYGNTNAASDGGSATFNGGQGTDGGAGNYVIYNANTTAALGTTSFTVTGLTAGTAYSFDAYEYNATSTCYLTPGVTATNIPSSCTPPTTQSSGITASSITNTSMVVSWTNGTGDQSILVGHVSSPVINSPVSGTSYSVPANPNTSFTGEVLSGSDYVLYVGSGTSTTLQNLTPGITYDFEVFSFYSATDCYNIATPASNTGTATALNPMTYTSSTTTGNATSVLVNTTNQQVIGLQIVTGGGSVPAITVNSITFSLNGSTLATDITKARIWYTGTSSTFATGTQFGSDQVSPALGTPYTITPGTGTTLAIGTNYFWIAYDVANAPPAVMFDLLHADCTNFNITAYAGTSNQTPTITLPTGSRQIQYCDYASFTAPAAASHITNVNLVGNTTTLNLTPTDPASSPYYSYYSTTVPDLTLSNSYTLKVTSGTSTKHAYNNVSAWVDWNQNGIYGDNANEFIGAQTLGTSSTQYSFAFTVPGTALAGNTAMRIVYDNSNSSTTTGFATLTQATAITNNSAGANVPCGTYAAVSGETEDYAISVVAAPCSGVIAGGTASAVTTSLCPNGSTTINISGQTTGVSGITYTWQQSVNGGAYSTISGSSSSLSTGALTNSGTSNVTYAYQCIVGCTTGGSTPGTSVATSPITVYPTPTITVDGSNTYSATMCSTGSPSNVSLTAANGSTGATTYAWAASTGLSGTTGATVTATPATTTSYTVTGSANSCTATATAAITVNPTTLAFTYNPSSGITLGGSTIITAAATSANGTVSYAWSPTSKVTSTLSASTGATVTANPLSTTVYTVIASDPGGCSITGSSTVSVYSGTPGTVSCGYNWSYIYSSGNWTNASSLGTPTVVASGASIDDNTYASIPIGFTFNFNDAPYTAFGISSNTFIWFGTGTCAANQYTPLSSTTGQSGNVDGVVSVYGMDNAAFGSTSAINVVTFGTPGSRTCVIEWLHFIVGKDNASTCIGAYKYPESDFQIRLYEGTNNIEYWYNSAGYDLTAAGGNQIDGGQVGIRSSVVTDYQARKANCTNGWNSSVTGLNTDICWVSGSDGLCAAACSIWPPNTGSSSSSAGQTYRWTPTAKPTITPTGQQNICIGAGGETLTANTTMSSPTYQWQTYSWPPSNSNIGGQTASTYLANPPTAGSYFYTVQVTSGSCVRNSDAEAVVLTQSPSVSSYGSSNPTTCGGSDGNITLNGLTASTTYSITYNLGGSPVGAANFTTDGSGNLTIGSLASGSYNNIVATLNGCSSSAIPASGSITLAGSCGSTTTTWTGATNNDWSTATNWSPEVVPNACAANVTINSGTPVITTSAISVGNITLGAGVTLTLNGQNLSVCGTWTGGSGSKAAVVGSGTTIISGSSAQTISGSTQFDVLQINNTEGVSLTAGAIAAISGGLQLQSGQLDVSAGTLHLLSTASNNNSYIDDFTGTGTLTGTIIADRYVPVAGSNQHFISSPVNSPALSQIGASGPDGSYVTPTSDCDEYQSATGSAYGRVFTYNDAHEQSGGCKLGNWEVKSAGNMTNGLGYSTYLTGNNALTVTGTANTGDISVNNLVNSGYPTVNTLQTEPIESGWVLVGNPYPSAINLTTPRTGFGNAVEVWQTSGPFQGSWLQEVIGEGPVVIPPFQAFMVLISGGAGSSYSYPFYQSERTRSATTTFYRTNTLNSLQLALDYNGVQDITTVTFNPSATTGFDYQYDAVKSDGAQGRPTLYTTMNDNHWYAINNIPLLENVTTVAVGLHPEVSGTMTITPQGIESFDPTTYVYLEDKQTSTWHNLRDGAYTFAANATDNQDRFVLHFTPPAEILTRSANCNTTGLITISQPGTANWSFVITDASNDIIATGTLNQANQVTVDANAGVYTVTLKDTAGYTVVKNIQVGGSAAIVAAFTSSATIAQTSEAVSFNSSADNSAIYNWNFGDGSTATGQDVTHDFTTPGVYTVQLTVTNTSGCVSTTTRVITVTSRSTTGITNINANGNISIWSNENRVYVDFSKETSVDAQVDIYNVLGQILSSEKFGKSDIYSKEIDNLDAAYLIIRVKNNDVVATKKVFLANINK